jgi:hypothetical protein
MRSGGTSRGVYQRPRRLRRSQRRGRPRKAPAGDTGEQQPKRPRGRPRKDAGAVQEPAAGGQAPPQPPGEKGAATGRRRERKGKGD